MRALSVCSLCKKPNGRGKAELRPYGENWALICAGCCFGDRDRIATAEKQFAEKLSLATDRSPVKSAVLDDDGPQPLPDPKVRN